MFVRTEGLISNTGNGEVDIQTGNGCIRDLNFSYSNGYEPAFCVNVSGSIGSPGIVVDGCSVVLDASTTLSAFAQVFPANGTFARHSITNNKVYGKVQKFFEYYANGDKNYATVSNNYVGQVVNGPTAQKALVYVKSSGSITPKYAYITAFGNVNADPSSVPAIVRDSIPGTSMSSNLSAWGNYGFLTTEYSTAADVNGLKTLAVARIPLLGPDEGDGYFNIQRVTVLSGGSQTVQLRNDSRPALVFVISQFNATSYAFFVNNDSSNTVISKGAAFEFGNVANPGVGTFRIWTSALNELTILNTNASTRSFTFFIMAT